MNEDIKYFALISTLLFVPKILLRFRIPKGITAMAIGFLVSYFLGWYEGSQTVYLLSSLGITSLFLFAGMEVDLDELKKDSHVLLKHLGTSILTTSICTLALYYVFSLEIRAALVLSLGLTTPSTGFILNSLNSFNFSNEEKYWIRSKAIAKEILALVIMFFALQSSSIANFSYSLGVILLMILTLPLLFNFFLKKVAPFAPDSEVSFLILIALLCGVITRGLGTYYLVGAFIVGIVAGRFRHFIDTNKSEKMLYSVGFFFSFFVPFYFFKAGHSLGQSTLNTTSILYGLGFAALFIPLRYFSVVLFIKHFLPSFQKESRDIAISLTPTLIFSLVIANILQTNFSVPSEIVNALIIYTMISSIVPSFLLERAAPEEYDTTLIRGEKV